MLIDIHKEINIRICRLNGGSRMNTIPTRAEAVIAVPESLVFLLEKKILELEKKIKASVNEEDNNINILFLNHHQKNAVMSKLQKIYFKFFLKFLTVF